MKKLLILLTGLVILQYSCTRKGPGTLEITDLKVEYSYEPKAVERAQPRFSWQLKDTVKGVVQNEYLILVSDKSPRVTVRNATIWNSGWINSDQNVFIDYNGIPLESGKDYYWTVRIKDNRGRMASPEKSSKFTMAKTGKDDWTAKWIAYNPRNEVKTLSGRPRSILLRNDFACSKKVLDAKVYISGLGNYQLFLNGKKAGDALLTPGWTDYRKRVQYQVYDVTELLNQGENTAGIMLGNMWWSSGLGWMGGSTYSDGPLMAIMQLEILYKDGEKQLVTTNDQWLANVSPIIDNTLYHGEVYDANFEIKGWNEPGISAGSWQNVEIKDMDSLVLSAQMAPEIRIMDEIKPVSLTEPLPGVYVFDLGINMVGSERINFKGIKGDTIKMKFAELLHEDGTVAQENLRSARATDMYIPSSDGEFTWQPCFTYHGYRYVQVEGLKTRPEKENLKGLRFYSSALETGRFNCSNELLNSIWANIMNGQKGNMESVPTDCPQRDERLGWTGDAQIFAPTSCYNMDMSGFFSKWMRDITDSQSEEGYTIDVNPAIVVGGPAKAGWGDAISVVPWVLYRFYDDKKVLEDNYDGIKAWVEYMKRKSEDYIYEWKPKGGGWEGYGDWIAVVSSPVEPISAAYYFYSTTILAKIALILDNKEDFEYYKALADSISQAFNRKFFDKEKINYPGGTQTANLLPLAFGLVPAEYQEQIIKNVAEDVAARGKHPSTGFLGTAYLLPLLSDHGYHQLAYETATGEEYPSWGYMVRNGATSMWELWNSDTEPPDRMNSRNHFALGSVGEWYYSHLAGIKPVEPGFKKIMINPMPAPGLEHASGEIMSPYGIIKSSWEVAENLFRLSIEIPCNTTAMVHLPLDFMKSATGLDEYKLECDNIPIKVGDNTLTEGIMIIMESETHVVLQVMSGRYDLKLTMNP